MKMYISELCYKLRHIMFGTMKYPMQQLIQIVTICLRIVQDMFNSTKLNIRVMFKPV